MALGCTVGRRQGDRGSVLPWAMFCWKTLDPGIHVDATFAISQFVKSLCMRSI